MTRGVGGEGGAVGGRDPMRGGGGMRAGGGTGNWGRGGVGGGYGGYRPLPGVLGPMVPRQMAAPAPAAAPAPVGTQNLTKSRVGAGMLSVPGGSPYGVNLPAYGYFGAPGQARPNMSSILGPMAALLGLK